MHRTTRRFYMLFLAIMAVLVGFVMPGCADADDRIKRANDGLGWHNIGTLRFDSRVKIKVKRDLVDSGLLEEGLALAASIEHGSEVEIRLQRIDVNSYRLTSRPRVMLDRNKKPSFLFPQVTMHDAIALTDRNSNAARKFEQASWGKGRREEIAINQVSYVPDWPRNKIGSMAEGLKEFEKRSKEAPDVIPDSKLTSFVASAEEIERLLKSGSRTGNGVIHRSYLNSVRTNPALRLSEDSKPLIENFMIYWDLILPGPGAVPQLVINFGERWMERFVEILGERKLGTSFHFIVNGWSMAQFSVSSFSEINFSRPITLTVSGGDKGAGGLFAYSILYSCGLLSLSSE